MTRPRTLNSNAATAAWDDVYGYKRSYRPAPVVIEIPLGSYLRLALVAIPLIVGLLVILPNPGGVS